MGTMNILFKLFVMYFKIGLFNFGGGLASIPLLQRELEKNGFMSNSEFFDVLSISQMTPGAIAMNTATFIGNRAAGIPGAIVATFSLALPSIIVILILAQILKSLKDNIYKKAIFFVLKSFTTALIFYAGYLIASSTWFTYSTLDNNQVVSSINIKTIVISVVMFVIAFKKKVNPIYLILSSGALGYIFLYLI